MIYSKFQDGQILRATKIHTPDGIYDASTDAPPPAGWYLVEDETELTESTINGIPATISRMRALMALKHKGYLGQVEETIGQIGGDTAIAYSNAQGFDRDSSFIAQLAQLLELSDKQVDELFLYANNLVI